MRWPAVRFRLLLPALSAAALACSSAPDTEYAEGPVEVVERHYAALAPGADWAALREDYTESGRIVRLASDAPGGIVSLSAEEWFAEYGPLIDAKEAFRVEVVGTAGLIYDRLATVWATVHLREHDPGAEPVEFRTVEQVSLVLGPDERWRISQVQYQDEAEGWDPPHQYGCDCYEYPYVYRSPYSWRTGFRVGVGYGRY